MIPFSVLDLSPVPEGHEIAEALANTVDLAQEAEAAGYGRYWMAEHHNMPGIASAATSVLIGHVAGKTRHIRVGAGGIMLPNHSPLVIAEQFGTLATLYPDRIDLGLGRAPGTDQETMQALRRNMSGPDRFPQDVMELVQYFQDEKEGQRVRAFPGVGTRVPVWILGSSLYGAQLAAYLGLPYAFASHFAPADLEEASQIYRATFQPSYFLEKPYFMMAVNVFAGADDAEGAYLRTSMQQAFAKMRTGKRGKLPAPVDRIEDHIEPALLRMVNQQLAISAYGSRDTVAAHLEVLIDRFQPDELIVNGQIHDIGKRIASFKIAAEILSARNG
ncbi:LLM class flavin-dependent oxidoreductase [Thalassobius vesicularis]|uniref:Luciferase-like monooxygenase n=1 Tax=Thalassobius vesicularis TaxID=1294297 RepID=A0A4S3MAU9_9RHOB|nr:LLM class flavin-dependent oxidoreductase [Thalassobius vesicularis]THD74894.1 LLM class flavin-dependent oxidoreductase [Thalassobius vesicularis]